MPVNRNVPITIDEPTSSAARARAFVNSDGFRGTVGLLQVFNLRGSNSSLSKDSNLKNLTNFVGVTFELSEAILKLRETQLTRSGETLTRFGKISLRGAGIAAAGITVIMCAWDAYDSFSARDDDAAWAYVGAGAAFTGVTVATVFVGASWAGPLGWICAGIGLGFIYLAYVLIDSPLEKFFKHYVFSDRKAYPNTSNLPTWEFNANFYNIRQLFMEEGQQMSYLVDCTRAAAELHDLLVCSQIGFTAQNLVREEMMTVMLSNKMSQTINMGYASSFLVSVSFNQFLRTPEQFISEAYYFKDGIMAGGAVPILGLQQKKVIERTSEQAPRVEQHIKLTSPLAHRANPNSCVLFICKLALHTQGYYPVAYDNQDRWLGAVINLQQTTATTILTFDYTNKKQTQIAEKVVLLSGAAWSDNN